MIQAILFDVYETLVDAPLYLSPYSHLFRSLETPSEAVSRVARRIMTRSLPTIEDTARFLEREFPGRTVSRSAIRNAEEELAEHLASFQRTDGLEEMIATLRSRGYTLALVSNVSSPYKEPIRRLGIEALMDHHVYSCDVGFAKPEREIFQIALERVGVRPSDAVMVGDDPISDIEGARSADLRAVLLDADSDGGISLPDLPRILAKMACAEEK